MFMQSFDSSRFFILLVHNLLGNLVILFISSNDSTMASISWLLLFMAEYPEIQKKVQDEIDYFAGRDGVVSFDDKAKLPYTMATIFEMLRWVSVAPFPPPRLWVYVCYTTLKCFIYFLIRHTGNNYDNILSIPYSNRNHNQYIISIWVPKSEDAREIFAVIPIFKSSLYFGKREITLFFSYFKV